MGRGDKRTTKGKIKAASYGKCRSHAKPKPSFKKKLVLKKILIERAKAAGLPLPESTDTDASPVTTPETEVTPLKPTKTKAKKDSKAKSETPEDTVTPADASSEEKSEHTAEKDDVVLQEKAS